MKLKEEGDMRFKESVYDAALGKYEEALEKDPTNEYTLGNMGLIYLKRNDLEKSVEYTNQSIE